MADYWDGSDDQPYTDPPNVYNPWHHMVNATHRLVSGIVNTVKDVTSGGPKPGGDVMGGGPPPPPSPKGFGSAPAAAPASGNTSGGSIDSMLGKAGFHPSEYPTMKAIIKAESGNNPNAINTANRNGTIDRGLAQINSVHKQYDPKRLMDPQYNLNAAHDIYKSQGLKAWSTYNNGAYKKFLGKSGELPPPPAAAHPTATQLTKPSTWKLPGLGVGSKTPAAAGPAKSKFMDPSLLSPSARKEAGMAPQHPVSHPGQTPTPVKRIGAVNGGHATTHPPVPPTSHVAPARHTRPPHAVAKPTGGTQHTKSSGAAAGQPAKPKIGTAEHFHHKPAKPAGAAAAATKKHHKHKKPKKTASKPS